MIKALKIQHLAAVVVGLHLLLGIFYSIVVPLWEAFDEWGHYPYVRYIATHYALPSRDTPLTKYNDTVRSQPPLYYIFGALASFWIDTSDWRDPIENRYSSLPTAMGGWNQALHTYDEDFPWKGWVLAVHVVRLVSVVFSTITVGLTYFIARTLFPNRSEVVFGAVAICAFWPQFIFVGSVVNNDSLVSTWGALVMLCMVRNIVRSPTWVTRIGLVLSQTAAVATKIVGLSFLPVTIWGLFVPLVQNRGRVGRRQILVVSLAVFGFIFLLMGAFVSMHPRYLLQLKWYLAPPRTVSEMPLGHWLSMVSILWQSLWIKLGPGSIGVDDRVYQVTYAMWLLALAGLIRFFFQRGKWTVKWAVVGLCVGFMTIVFMTMYRGLFNPYYFVTGRYILSTISAIAVLLAVGLGSLGPRRWSQVIIGVVGVAMFLFAVYVPFAYIIPVYARPQKLPPTAVENLTNPLHANFDGKIELVGYEVEPATFYPGQTIKVSLYWRCLEEMTENYTLAIKIIGPDDQEYSSLNVHPGRGNYPTSMWRRGDIFKDEYWMPIVGDATPLTMARLKVAFFLDRGDLPHLPAYDQSGQKLGFAVFAGRFKIAAIHKPKYEPQQVVNYRLGEAVSLVGYDLPARVEAGAPLTLTLYWRAHGATERPYTVFVHVTDARGELRAQADRQPLGGSYPTDLWGADEVISDPHTIALPAELPAGRYGVVVGLYSVETGQRLPVSDSEGRPMSFDQIELGRFELAGGA